MPAQTAMRSMSDRRCRWPGAWRKSSLAVARDSQEIPCALVLLGALGCVRHPCRHDPLSVSVRDLAMALDHAQAVALKFPGGGSGDFLGGGAALKGFGTTLTAVALSDTACRGSCRPTEPSLVLSPTAESRFNATALGSCPGPLQDGYKAKTSLRQARFPPAICGLPAMLA